VKAVFLNDCKYIDGDVRLLENRDIDKTQEELITALLSKNNIALSDLDYGVATGMNLMHLPFINEQIAEPIALGKWANTLSSKKAAIMNIGYQQVNAYKFDDGRLFDISRSDSCAAGTGMYLEMLSDLLDMNLETINPTVLKSFEAVQIESTCAVFAETEIISLLHQEKKPHDILKGAINALGSRLYSLLMRIRPNSDIYIIGGYASNASLVKALEIQIGQNLIVPERPQVVVAYGAALVANSHGVRDKMK
jgi:predicted CoA-substrate-specific enzyme activase